MRDQLPWFKCEPGKLLGALAALTPEDGYLYTIVLLRIYENGGPVREDVAMLARRSGMTRKSVEKSLESLIEKGKLQLTETGAVDSSTTHGFLADREKLIKYTRQAGKASAKKRGYNIEANQHIDGNERSTNVKQKANEEEREEEVQERKITDSSTNGQNGHSVDLLGFEENETSKAIRTSNLDSLRIAGETWNGIAAALKLPTIEAIKTGSSREKQTLARTRDLRADYGFEPLIGWTTVTNKVRGSPYLRGEINDFRATYDWVIAPKNFQKIMEGNYEVRQKVQQNGHDFGRR